MILWHLTTYISPQFLPEKQKLENTAFWRREVTKCKQLYAVQWSLPSREKSPENKREDEIANNGNIDPHLMKMAINW